jgi:hypothetical protein
VIEQFANPDSERAVLELLTMKASHESFENFAQEEKSLEYARQKHTRRSPSKSTSKHMVDWCRLTRPKYLARGSSVATGKTFPRKI